MKSFLLFPAIAASLHLTGCGAGSVMSLKPFFAEGDLYDDPRIEKIRAEDGTKIERVSLGKYRLCDSPEKDCLHPFVQNRR